MKVFISADIEGTAGILSWDETIRTHADYAEFRELMTQEVVAACEGARSAGADEILIKDAHGSGRNLILNRLPAFARIVRGWSGHPDSMMFGLDNSFAGALYIGYHSKAGTETNALAHTFNMRISRLLLNGEVASEFTINALCAARHGVPSIFLSGDAGICADAKQLVPNICTVETLQGVGSASISLTPAASIAAIREGVEQAVKKESDIAPPPLAHSLELVIEFNNPTDAYRASWYPNASPVGERAVCFKSDSFFEVQRALRFMTS